MNAQALRVVEAPESEMEWVGSLAVAAMSNLYSIAAGGPPQVARAYHEDDALLLLLRFDPDHLSDSNEPGSLLGEAALMALPDMIASAVRAETGRRHRLIPGSLTISGARGVVSLGFSVVLAQEENDDPLSEHEHDTWPTPRLALVTAEGDAE